MASPGSLSHLAARFVDVATARELSDSERSAVERWLSPPLADLFFDQPDHDQRHGYDAALSVIARGNAQPDVVIAALVHDIGKRHADLGLVGRSLASLLILTGMPLPDRFAVYRDHGLVGAAELGRAGAPSLAIDFCLHHHDERPQTVDQDIWEDLIAADQPPQSGRGGVGRRVLRPFDSLKRQRSGITSDDT